VEIIDRECLLMIEQRWKYPNNDRPRRTRPIGDLPGLGVVNG